MSHSTDHTFSIPGDLSTFPDQTQRILRMADALGWHLRWLGVQKKLANMTSPDHSKSINVPSTNVNANRMKSWFNQIVRYSDPEKVADYAEQELHPATARGLSGAMRIAMPEYALPDERTATRIAYEEGARAKQTKVKAAAPSHDVKVARPDDVVPADTHIVSEKPWMVRKGGSTSGTGRMYESPHVTERLWSDGHVDYKCKYCPYTHESGRSVSSHVSRTILGHPKKNQPLPPVLHVNDYEPTDIKRPMSAMRRMKTELLHILDSLDDWQAMAPDMLAEQVAEALYAERPDREPVAPLTPQQILDRITLMVDAGRTAELHQQVEAAGAALRSSHEASQQMSRDLEAANAKIASLQEERRALASMLSEEQS